MWKYTVLSLLYALGLAKWEKRVAPYEMKALDKFQVRALYDAYSTAPNAARSKSTWKDDGGFGRIVRSREIYEDKVRGTIVFDCTSLCGGIGDRLKGITYLFLMASHLRANLRIKWPRVRHAWTLKPSYDYFKWNTGGRNDRAVWLISRRLVQDRRIPPPFVAGRGRRDVSLLFFFPPPIVMTVSCEQSFSLSSVYTHHIEDTRQVTMRQRRTEMAKRERNDMRVAWRRAK